VEAGANILLMPKNPESAIAAQTEAVNNITYFYQLALGRTELNTPALCVFLSSIIDNVYYRK